MSCKSQLLAIAITAALVAGCGGSGKPESRRPITVFAAASLTEAFNDTQTALRSQSSQKSRLTVTFSFGGSGALATQVQQGAPADVIATADLDTMKKLTDAGLVESPTTFARNKLEILVAPNNPRHVLGLTDLARNDVKFVTEEDTVPAGKYATEALAAAAVSAKPVSKELDVKAAVAKVVAGEADATIVYATDVKAAGTRAAGVTIPDAQNVIARYPIAIVKATKHREAAVAFVKAVTNGPGRRALQQRGFLPAA